MTDEQIERMVTRIIRQQQPPVLVMVTAACGYRDEIRTRLAACGQPLHLILDDEVTDITAWRSVGNVLSADSWQESLPPVPFQAVVLPFLDYALAAQLVNGTLQTRFARRLHDALLTGLPVLALRYHCDPASELNQLRGAIADSAYARHMQTTLDRLAGYGITLCTINELLEKLKSGPPSAAPVNATQRYLTLAEVINNPAQVTSPHTRLTDAACEFLKNRKL